MRPQKRVPTQIKGWQADARNISYDEQVAVCTSLKKNDITMAKIILDFTNKKIIRNGWNNDKSFDELFAYFHAGYPQYTTEVMLRLDPEYLVRFQPVQEEPIIETVVETPPVMDAIMVTNTISSSVSSSVTQNEPAV